MKLTIKTSRSTAQSRLVSLASRMLHFVRHASYNNMFDSNKYDWAKEGGDFSIPANFNPDVDTFKVADHIAYIKQEVIALSQEVSEIFGLSPIDPFVVTNVTLKNDVENIVSDFLAKECENKYYPLVFYFNSIIFTKIIGIVEYLMTATLRLIKRYKFDYYTKGIYQTKLDSLRRAGYSKIEPMMESIVEHLREFGNDGKLIFGLESENYDSLVSNRMIMFHYLDNMYVKGLGKYHERLIK